MKTASPIAVIVACDNHYLVLLAALLKSIEFHHKSDEFIEVFIVDDGIKAGNRRKLTASLDPGKIHLSWIPLDEAIPDTMRIPFDRTSYPKNIHTRIFIPHFIMEYWQIIPL